MYKKIKEMEVGKPTTTVLLITGIEERKTKNNGSYCVLSLSDGEQQITAKLWNCKKEEFRLNERGLGNFTLNAKLYMDKMDYEISSYTAAPTSCQITDFVVKAPYRGQDMYDAVLKTLKKTVPVFSPDGSPTLVALVEKIYESNKDELMYWSGAKTIHHNCYGGLMYHTYRMMMSGYMLLKVYSSLDPELLLCGIALHDIGKIRELETDDLGIADYTVSGSLFGHALLGIQIIDETLRQLETEGMTGFNQEKIMLLKHMIASHHGQLDWGAVTLPAIPEAQLLHFIDNIDAKMYCFEDVARDLEPGTMSDRVFALGNACVYKPTK